ncbi:MAG: response regulator transcription factor [Chloroflexi bacterium]|nr:response regulator transcription factor [Chloroflexota bacterium]MYD48523.1 response regulator transcription factor [Chloroflexota bacterium]
MRGDAGQPGYGWDDKVYNVFLLTRPGSGMVSLVKQIDDSGVSCRAGSDVVELDDAAHAVALDVVLLDLSAVGIGAQAVIERVSQLGLPTMLVVDSGALPQYDPAVNVDDFIVAPLNPAELMARVGQMVFRRNGRGADQVVRVGELTIDLQSYEVTMAGRRISLTYKEFQLLTLLASNPGRVYSREALLNQVWGYDYLGGTRTVDVHIRRLRSKVEDPDHLFVETIWNVGYRFRDIAAEG